ncbi:MAG TPA: hypothetical protein PK689_03485, partial [Kiritimatiellia bacterium]|nr:hypothetical protein [Kiritimatiellia bacterium]
LRSFIDSSAPVLLQLRQAGPEGQTVANAWTALFRGVAETQRAYPDRKIHRVLQDLADQTILDEPPEVRLGRRLAMLLAGKVATYRTARGEIKLDYEDTTRAWTEMLDRLARSVRAWQEEARAGGDIFGGSRNLLTAVTDWLRANGGDVIVANPAGPAMAEDTVPYDAAPGSAPPPPMAPDVRRRRSWRWRQVGRLKAGDLVQYGPPGAETTLEVSGLERTADRAASYLRLALPGQPEKWLRLRLSERDTLYSLAQHEDPTRYQSGPDPRVRRFKELMRLRERAGGKLPPELERELEAIEQALGQSFLAFYAQQTLRPAPKPGMAGELEAGMKRRLRAAPLATQATFGLTGLDDPGQMGLFDPGFLPGLNVQPQYVSGYEAPRVNTRIEGPRARSERANRQLQLGGLEPTGQSRPRLRGGLARREVITARADRVPARSPEARDWFRGGHEGIAALLDAHQVEGVQRLLDGLEREGYFGLFDGPGAGKTMQELAAAQILAAGGRGPVLIVTERQGIIDDAFAKDAEHLGIPIWQWRQGPIEPGQAIFLATYFDVGLGKVPAGVFPTLIFDEAHNLRNVDKATKSRRGLELAAAAQRVVFATATPLDQPQQLWYLAPLLDETPEAALLRIGIKTWRHPAKPGVMKFLPAEGVTQYMIESGLEEMFDRMYERGLAIKREVPLDNLVVNLRRVHIEEEQRREVREVMAQAEAHYRRLGVPNFTVRGLTLMVGRQALEKFKVIQALGEVDRILQAGKKVLLYAYRVQDGMWVANNGLEALADMLEQRYGPGSVGRLFGGDNTVKSQRYRQQVLERFQHGSLRILVGHPQMAGTGINADDIYGDAPREIVMITPPYSALEMVQIAGRIARLTTRSQAVMNLLITDTGVDTWNLDIYLRKFRNLRAAVKGDVDRLRPRPEEHIQHEPQTDYRLSEPAPATDPRQLEFNWRNDLALLGRVEPVPLPRGTAGVGEGAWQGLPPGGTAPQAEAIRVRATVVKQRLLEAGQINLVGQECRGIEDAIVLAQVIRSRSFETSLWIFEKG